MSETPFNPPATQHPRTDRQPRYGGGPYVHEAFANVLEMELADATAEITRLTDSLAARAKREGMTQ